MSGCGMLTNGKYCEFNLAKLRVSNFQYEKDKYSIYIFLLQYLGLGTASHLPTSVLQLLVMSMATHKFHESVGNNIQ